MKGLGTIDKDVYLVFFCHPSGRYVKQKDLEIIRIQSMLYGYQFTETLRYVGERLYEKYPDSFYDYLDVRTKELTAQGRDVDIAK